MYRSIATLLSVALLLAGQAAIAQSSKPVPVAADPAPAVPWCPPGQSKGAAGKCVAPAPTVGQPKLVGQQTIDGRSVPVSVSTPPPAPAAKPPATVPTVYQTVNGVRTAVGGPGAAQASVAAAEPDKPRAAPTKAIAAGPIPQAISAPVNVAMGEPSGDCTTRAPNLIHDSRSPGGCAPCPRGRVPNAARQACVIPIPRRS